MKVVLLVRIIFTARKLWKNCGGFVDFVEWVSMSLLRISRLSMLNRGCYRTFSTSQDDKKWFCLFYDYVDNILEKRGPIRPDHFKHISAYVEDGRCKLGGAFADNNVDGALCVFHCQDISEVEEFAKVNYR